MKPDKKLARAVRVMSFVEFHNCNFLRKLTLFHMGYFPTDFPWEVVTASPAHVNDFLKF